MWNTELSRSPFRKQLRNSYLHWTSSRAARILNRIAPHWSYKRSRHLPTTRTVASASLRPRLLQQPRPAGRQTLHRHGGLRQCFHRCKERKKEVVLLLETACYNLTFPCNLFFLSFFCYYCYSWPARFFIISLNGTYLLRIYLHTKCNSSRYKVMKSSWGLVVVMY